MEEGNAGGKRGMSPFWGFCSRAPQCCKGLPSVKGEGGSGDCARRRREENEEDEQREEGRERRRRTSFGAARKWGGGQNTGTLRELIKQALQALGARILPPTPK